MNAKVNYTAVGFFVISLSIGLIYAILWLSAGTSHKKYHYYQINFSESVSGLNIQSPVKYNGVQVGFVSKIQLNKKDPSQVIVLLAIESDVPIYENTTAQIDAQGVTGIAYIGLRGSATPSNLLIAKNDNKYPIMATRPSLFSRLNVSLDNLTKKLSEIAVSINSVLSKSNQKDVEETLNNVAFITKQLAKNTTHLDSTLNNISIIAKNTAAASNDFPSIMHDAKVSLSQISATMQQAHITVNSINNNLQPQLQTTLQNIATISQKISSLTSELQQDPAILIHGKASAAPGPGETR